MLLSYESSYATARTASAIEHLTEMNLMAEYVDGRGNIISHAAKQQNAFFVKRNNILKIAQQLRGDHIKD